MIATPTKRRQRRNLKRRQRAKAKLRCAIDFETRHPLPFGDTHVGDRRSWSDDQIIMYETMLRSGEVTVIQLGDLLHEKPKRGERLTNLYDFIPVWPKKP